MSKKFYQNEKFQGYFFPILYFVLSIAIVVTSCIIFKNKYYTSILVDGPSMQPTLVGGGALPDGSGRSYRSHYGYADMHESAINNFKRFDVCVTHYPDTWVGDTETLAIKRVWGFPGETLDLVQTPTDVTFTVTKNDKEIYKVVAPIESVKRSYQAEAVVDGKLVYSSYTREFQAFKFFVGNKTFYTMPTHDRSFHKELAKNEYFVMGDNWGNSNDSFSQRNNPDLLTKRYLQGKAICIYAYATANGNEATRITKISPRYNF